MFTNKVELRRRKAKNKPTAPILIVVVALGMFLFGLLLAACQSTEASSKAADSSEMSPALVSEAALTENELELIREASAARWELMGEYYSALAAAAREQGAQADQARWDAMGRHYSALSSGRPERAEAADQARWDAMGEFYQSLASDPVPEG